MKIDIERYLNHEMNDEERERFEQQLNDDPQLREELEEGRVFLDLLKTQMLRERVAAALTDGGEDHPPQKTTTKIWLWLIGLLLLVTVAAILLFSKNDKPDTLNPPADTPAEMEPPSENIEAAPPPDEKDVTEETPTQPIAENPSAQPPANQPNVRGEAAEADDWEQLVASIWTTRFDPKPGEYNGRFSSSADLLREKKFTDAFIKLHLLEQQVPANDTLAFLKGYCLLELREGAEALQYFEKLPKKNTWETEVMWMQGLCYLLTNDKQKAVNMFKTINAVPKHPYQKEAKGALEVLK